MKFGFRVLSIFFLSGLLFMVGCVGPNSSKLSAAGELSEKHHFTLKNLSGEAVSLDSVLKSHKAVLVNFWATWCPPCREEIPGLIKLQEQYKNSSFTVLGVDVGESEARVSPFVQKMKINYPVVLDGDMSVAEAYRVVGIPTSYLISGDGKILGEYHAYTRELVSDVEKALQ